MLLSQTPRQFHPRDTHFRHHRGAVEGALADVMFDFEFTDALGLGSSENISGNFLELAEASEAMKAKQ
jgi:hypothetical protein